MRIPINTILLLSILVLFSQCKKDENAQPGSDTIASSLNFDVLGDKYIQEKLDFVAAVPRGVDNLTWYFGNGHQNETIGYATTYSYDEVGEYVVTLEANGRNDNNVTKRINITKGTVRLNGERDYTCTYHKRHKSDMKGEDTTVTLKFAVEVVDDATIILSGAGPFYQDLPATLKGENPNNLIFKIEEPTSAIELEYNNNDRFMGFSVYQTKGDSILEFSAIDNFDE